MKTNYNKKLSDLKVLIVEDDEISAFLMQAILKNKVEEIKHTARGLEAIDFLKVNPCDVVLMDIKMPGIDGLETTKKIREFNKEIIIIAQTAFATTNDHRKAIDAGCNNFITKPIVKEKLFKMIENEIQNLQE